MAIVAFALVASGCGGAETPVPDPNTAGAVPTPALNPDGTVIADSAGVTEPLTGGGEDAAPGANEISGADAAIGKLVKVSAITPARFKQAHCDKAIMVLYYQPDAVVDGKLVAEARAAAASVGNIVTLTYTPKDVKAAGDLPSKLGLFETPGLATVGRDGKIRNFWTTYVDRSLIARSLHNASAAKPCKLGSGDVPAAGEALQDAALVASGGTLEDESANPLAGTESGTPAVDAAGSPTGVSIDPLTGAPIA